MNKGLIIPIMKKYEDNLIENIRNLFNNYFFSQKGYPTPN